MRALSRPFRLPLVVMAVAVAPVLSAAPFYADGDLINLATIRGAVPTASGNLDGGYAALLGMPLHASYGNELRWQSNSGPAWYQIDLGDTYQLSSYTVYLHSVFSGADLSIKASTTPLSDAQWGALAPLQSATLATLPHNGSSNKGMAGSFPAVPARYVRLELANPVGWTQMILQTVKLTGPNDAVPVNNRISLAQTGWAGAITQWSDPWFTQGGTPGNRTTTVQNDTIIGDDFYLLRTYYTNTGGVGINPGNPADPLVVEPSRFYVTMNDTYMVDTVAWASISDSRRVRDLNLYASYSAAGNDWFLVKALTDLPNTQVTSYYEVTLDQPLPVRRFRFDALTVYTPTPHSTLLIAEGYFSEFYVYGAVPEPAAGVLLGLAGLALPRRRRQ
jgi:hypothetical protein